MPSIIIRAINAVAAAYTQARSRIVAELNEVLDEIGAWGTGWRDRALAAEAAAEASDAARVAAEAHAQAVVDNDAAEDIAQLQATKDEAVALALAKRDELAALDTPPEAPPATEGGEFATPTP